jgi:alkanesulfonate monooxygenase SsuD/methylene tetrahydromethanopterin reductase-like flavin-dependent oxidoreductase (luciferase family)
MRRSDFRFCLNFITDERLETLHEWWSICESAGVDYIGVPDSPMLVHETFVTAGYAALCTQQIGVMTAMTNPVSRDPSVMASALFSLESLAPGRIVCGIATGDSAMWTVGLKPAKVDRLVAYVTAVKALLRGEEAEFEGRRFRASWKQWSRPVDVPLYIACAGPKVLRRAAQIADGVVICMGFSPEKLASVNKNIEEACAEVERDPAELDIWWQTTITFAPTVEEAMERSIGVNTSWMTTGSLEGKQIPPELVGPLLRFNADMEDASAAYGALDRGKVLVARARELGLYDWLVSMSPGFWGPPANVARRLREFREHGMTNWQFDVAPFHGGRNEYVESFVGGVLPALDEDQAGAGSSTVASPNTPAAASSRTRAAE